MIQFSKVKKSFGDRTLFDEATFTLGKQERCGIVGRNGCGKTTLFRMILGEESVDEGHIIKPKHYRLGTLQQHLKFTESSILAEALMGLPVDERDQEWRAEIILEGLGFSQDDLERAPSEFSGGFQLRLQLAKVLLSEPDCLLLDEPTNYLDIVAIRWLETALKEWPGELIVISHDKAFLDKVCTHTMGIYRGKLSKIPGNVEAYYTKVLTDDMVHEKTRQKMDKKKAHLQSYIDRFGAKASKATQAQSKQKQLEKMSVLQKLAAEDNLGFSFKMAPFPGRRCLEVENLSFSYDANSSFSIEDFSMNIGMGERIAIIGKNGRGKSTLLSLLAKNLTPNSGSWNGSNNLRIGYFGQTHISRLNPKMTVEEEIGSVNPNLAYGEVRGICGLMMFSGDAAKKTMSVLSGGEKSRVLLGKILAKQCNFLLLDEPTHHLDMESVEALLQAVNNFAGTVILVTHDESLLKNFSDRLIVCSNGPIKIFEGDYPTFLKKIGWEKDSDEKPAPKQSSQKEEREKRIAQEKEISKCERAIEQSEIKLKETQILLEKAVNTGDQPKILSLSAELTALEEKIEQLTNKFLNL